MPLDSDRQGSAIAAAVQSAGVVAGTPITPAQLETIWKAISFEEHKEFKDNAVVPVSVASVGGVTPGGGSSGPGTGSGTIT